jgi:Swi5 protein
MSGNARNLKASHVKGPQITDGIKETMPVDPPLKSPEQAKLDQLHETYLQITQQRRFLLLQLQSNLTGVSQNSHPTPCSMAYLPSIHAHSRPITPLTPVIEEELLRKAGAISRNHIKQLQRYNEIRDVGQGLIGMIAENRKLRIRDVMEEFGVTDAD